MPNFIKRPGYYSLSKRITLFIAAITGLLFVITSTTVYLALSARIDAEDTDLIETKAHFITPYITSGNVNEIQSILEWRYPQDLRKRVYVAVYDQNGTNVASTFNVNASNRDTIFPTQSEPNWSSTRKPILEKLKSGDERVFSVSTRTLTDKFQRPWILRIAVDHDPEDRIIHAVGFAFVLILIISIAVIALSSGVVKRFIQQPLNELSGVMRRIVPGQNTATLSHTDFPIECEDLINSFNSMSQKAHTAFIGLQSFSANISHELRNPLNSMIVNLELLLSGERSKTEYHESAVSLLEDAQKLSRLIDRLLFLLRGERKLLKADMIVTPLKPLLIQIGDLYRPLIEERGGTLSVDCEETLTVFAEPQLLRQCILNLVENAIKYGQPPNKDTPQSLQLEGLKFDQKRTSIAVKDNGPGIAPEDLPYIFDRLYRADQSRSAIGFGLGLAIVRMIAEIHGGTIEVRRLSSSDLNTFILTLPNMDCERKY